MNKYEQQIKRLTDWGDLPLEKQDPNPVLEDRLDAVEHEFGHPLPTDYPEFLRHYGGLMVLKYFPIRQPKREDVWYGEIDTFYPVDASEWRGRGLRMLSKETYSFISNDYLVMGFSERGYILIAVDGECRGAIYFWDSSDSSVQDESMNIHPVASSFGEFMHLLEEGIEA